MPNDEHLTQTEAMKSQQISKALKNEQILSYAWDMKKNGRTDITIATNVKRLYQIARHCRLNNPEAVKSYLSEMKCSNRYKNKIVQTYHNFLEFLGVTWKKPTYKPESKIPYIPTEEELDQLINSAHAHKTAAYLQLLKETGARLGEALKVKWIDLNEERKTIYIHAEKNSNDRVLPISERLIAMLHNIPKKDEYIFHCKAKSIGHTFEALRNRTAIKLQNPRLKQIHLHTFRHWKGTMWQHEFRDTWLVKEYLGHKHLKSTEIYIHIDQMFSNYKDDKYVSAIARNETEECQLIESGFEHVADRGELHFYRKRK